jgi:hypothetical protein
LLTFFDGEQFQGSSNSFAFEFNSAKLFNCHYSSATTESG